jgi:hypothetical protein
MSERSQDGFAKVEAEARALFDELVSQIEVAEGMLRGDCNDADEALGQLAHFDYLIENLGIAYEIPIGVSIRLKDVMSRLEVVFESGVRSSTPDTADTQ